MHPTNNSFFNGQNNTTSLPTSPASDSSQASPLTPPALLPNDNLFSKVSDIKSASAPLLRSSNNQASPHLTQLTPLNQINGFNGLYPSTPDRLTPLSPQHIPNNGASSPVAPVPNSFCRSDKDCADKNNSKSLHQLGGASLDSIIPPLGVMHNQMGAPAGLNEVNNGSTTGPNQTQMQAPAGPPGSGLSQGYNDEEELPSCAFAHPRLHGLPFLVHGKWKSWKNSFFMPS